jgi:rfaE bifunctional protein kinase chain/domain
MTLLQLIDSFKELKVAVIGDPILDHYIVGDTTRVSPEAPVPIVNVETERWALGGAANVAANVSMLGAATRLVARFGFDDHGKVLLGLLQDRGIDVRHLLEYGPRTTVKTRIISRGQQICRIDRDCRPEDCFINLDTHERAVMKGLTAADICIVADYGKGAVSSRLMTRLRHPSLDDMFVALDPHQSHMVACSGVDLITPNLHEAEAMAAALWCRGDGVPGLVRALANLCVRNTAITLGPGGIAVGSRGRYLDTLPAVAKQVFDVSGAGDTVIAVMSLALKKGAPIGTAAILANLAAGVVVGQVGTHPIAAHELKEAVLQSPFADHEFEAV